MIILIPTGCESMNYNDSYENDFRSIVIPH